VLIQKTQNILAAGPSIDAALSHAFPQRGDEFLAADRAAFKNARHDQHIGQDARVH
jgi:hypothetical protein